MHTGWREGKYRTPPAPSKFEISKDLFFWQKLELHLGKCVVVESVFSDPSMYRFKTIGPFATLGGRKWQ
jgi:hypothetical protein